MSNYWGKAKRRQEVRTRLHESRLHAAVRGMNARAQAMIQQVRDADAAAAVRAPSLPVPQVAAGDTVKVDGKRGKVSEYNPTTKSVAVVFPGIRKPKWYAVSVVERMAE